MTDYPDYNRSSNPINRYSASYQNTRFIYATWTIDAQSSLGFTTLFDYLVESLVGARFYCTTEAVGLQWFYFAVQGDKGEMPVCYEWYQHNLERDFSPGIAVPLTTYNGYTVTLSNYNQYKRVFDWGVMLHFTPPV